MNKKPNEEISNFLDQLPRLIWKTDKELQINYVNKVWEDFTGKDINESLNYGWENVVHPDDLDKLAKVRAGAMKDEEGSFNVEIRFRRFDGVYRWCLVTGAPYYEIDKSFVGYLGSIYDITERKEAEDSLKLYKMLSDTANDIILFIDMDGRIIEANNAAVKAYGYTYEELCSMLIHNIREDWGYTNKQMVEAYQKGIYFLAVHKRKDGSIFPVEVSSKGAYFGNSRVLLSIIRDITHIRESELELKKAKEAAEVASRAKSEFLANMSHEIRTPLNGMVGMIDLTLLTDISNEQKDKLLTAKSCANSLLKIISDILDFSKMEAGKLTLEIINFNLKDLINELIKVHTLSAREKGLELNYTFSSEIPEFLIGDPNRISQILNNLISNAIKFTNEGTISLVIKKIAVENNEVQLMFSITDTGIGVSAKDTERIFRSFSQLDPSYTKKYNGTGLGLTITKQLVEMMGGNISVKSEKGKGSIFCVFLSFKIGTDNKEKFVKPPLFVKTTKPIKILLVEDDVTNQRVIMKMLNKKGHTVETANNGHEAVLLFRKGKYDVILMDIQMPIMNGIDAAKRIKEIDDSKNPTPIIALTAYALQGDREKFLSMGMDGYISKPIKMDELFNILDRIANRSENYNNFIPDRVIIKEDQEIGFVTDYIYKPLQQIEPYLAEINNLIVEMEVAIGIGDFMSTERTAHKIKIISNEIDAFEIKDGAFKIQLAARRGDLNRINIQIEKIKHKFKTYKESI